ncbi:MAG: winged helix-turn-helix domain-containing protein [Pyrinomonadaceae bacterium]|nr:winged helix-turn-helix domain-containing protein [Pyrinomonadaceae bacterium]
MTKEQKFYEFEEFRLDVEDKTLWRGQEKLSLPLKAVEMLTLLVENRGRTVTKDEILETLWQDTFVDENNLAVTVSSLRKAFGESKNDNRFIETVPRRGYRFVADVSQTNGNLILEKHTITEITLEKDEVLEQSPIKRNQIFAVLGILAIILLVGAVYLWRTSPNGKDSSKSNVPLQTIAVLPFKFIGEKPKDGDYLSASIVDTLTTRLGRLRDLRVRPSSSVLAFAGTEKTLPEIGKELQVDSILTGNLQTSGERTRVNLQMVKVSNGSIIWADDFDEKTADIFLLQDKLTAKVVNRLALNLNDEQRTTLSKKYTADSEAEKLYIQGRVYWNERSLDGLKKSIEYFEQALKRDQNYALAYVGLADSYQLLAEYKGLSTNEAYSKARINVTKALELDPDLAEAHNSLAYIQAFFDWDWARGEASFKRAIELNPNYATAHHWYSELLYVEHRFDEAEKQLNLALELDPSSASIQSDVPHRFFVRRDYEKTLAEANKMVEKHPQFGYSYMYLYGANVKLGREKEAVDAIAKMHIYFGEDEKLVLERIRASEKGGLKGYWQKCLEQSQTKQLVLRPEAIDYAMAYQILGDFDKSFKYLEKSLEERNRWFLEITYDPEWDAIRNDPRYKDLIRKANLTFSES